MSWKKRPSNIKTLKTSTRVPFHIGIVIDEVERRQKDAQTQGVEKTERIVTGDL